MHLTCTLAQAVFPFVGLRLFTDKPLSLLWDCHHGDTFVLKVGELSVAPSSAEAEAPAITLEVALHPAAEVLGKIDYFAAHHNLSLTTWSTLPAKLTEPLTLAACHLPEAKLFVFCEQAILAARPTPEGNVLLAVQGDFKSRKVPCQETDLLLHLERAHATRLLSYCFTLVRGRL